MRVFGTAFDRRSRAARRAADESAQNRYEGGQLYNPRRSYIPAFVQDQRFDADTATRRELVRKARYFERNSALMNRWADLYEEFTIGPNGLQLIPDSRDDEWNERAAEVWRELSEEAELGTQFSLADSQLLGARTEFVEGEFFMLKTRGGDYPRRPRVQLFESHRVATPDKLWDVEGEEIVDGIQVDPKTGQPLIYWLADNFLDGKSFRPVPASQIIHIFSPSRIGQKRGLPYIYPIVNDLHDLDDLQIFEMDAAKLHAQVANVVFNETGEASDEQLRRQRFTIKNTPDLDTNVTEELEREKYYRTVLGSRTVYAKHGDKIEQPRTERPGAATQNYWDYLTAKACAGVGISKLLVYPWSIQGTVARADFDIANAFFRSRSRLHAWAAVQVYCYFMGWARYNDSRVVDAPADWRRVTVRPPRAVNVDVGRNSKAMIDEVAAGMKSIQDVYSELGKDWRRELRQKAKEAAYIKSLAVEYGVEKYQISIGQEDRPERIQTEPREPVPGDQSNDVEIEEPEDEMVEASL